MGKYMAQQTQVSSHYVQPRQPDPAPNPASILHETRSFLWALDARVAIRYLLQDDTDEIESSFCD